MTAAPGATFGKPSYTEILKSTAVVGGSSLATIAVGIVRNKAIAMMLGPEGIGLMSLYQSIVDLAQSLAGFGVQSSGVRQIAEAVGSGDKTRIAWTATVLRRVSLVLGILGALLLAALTMPISELTFGDRQHFTGIALLGLAVFMRSVSAGQAALIQGMRRVADLARLNILAAILGCAATLPLIYAFGLDGVVFAIIAAAAVTVVLSWYYSKKLLVEAPPLPVSRMWPETANLLKLGFAFLASGLFTLGASYAIRIILLQTSGVDATGLYQAAWTLGGLYTGIILTAMGADFYPRLTAVASSDAECNRLVNEQAQVCMLLAGPGVIATLTLAPLVMVAFYSAQFQAAVPLLRWICLGMMLRVVAWPMGFVVLAKGHQKTFLWTEAAATLVHVGVAWLLMRSLGVDGAGIAFFVLYVWHSFIIYLVVRRSTGFRWSAENQRLCLVFIPAAVLTFACLAWLPTAAGVSIGLAATLATGLYSLRYLLLLCPPHLVPHRVRPFLAKSM